MTTKLIHDNGIEITLTSNEQGNVIEGIKFVPFNGSYYFTAYNGLRLETVIELLSIDGFRVL